MPPQAHKERPDKAIARAIDRSPFTASLQANRPRRFTAYTIAQLLERHRDPRDILLEIAGYPILKLMRVAKCSALEAISEKRLAAMAVLPYVASKMPVDVTIKHTKAVHLNIVDPQTYHELQVTAEQDAAPMQLVNAARVTEAEIIEQPDAQQPTPQGDERSVALSTASDESSASATDEAISDAR